MRTSAEPTPSARDGAEDAGRLAGLIAELPERLRRQAVTHSSWVDDRVDSYGRLAFLGDGVLGLAIAEHLFAAMPDEDIGRLTKVHGQAVSGRACRDVAEVLGLPELIERAEPATLDSGISAAELLRSERAMSSMTESVIGACYLTHGFEATAEAVVAAFAPQIELAVEFVLDFKSELQEMLARDGRTVSYAVVAEEGPPHQRRFEVEALVDSERLGHGVGASKKAAEQAAAADALRSLGAGSG